MATMKYKLLVYDSTSKPPEVGKIAPSEDNGMNKQTPPLYSHQCYHTCCWVGHGDYRLQITTKNCIFNNAATIIQANWKGYLTRKMLWHNGTDASQVHFRGYKARETKIKKAASSNKGHKNQNNIKENRYANPSRLVEVQRSTHGSNVMLHSVESPVNPSVLQHYYNYYNKQKQFKKFKSVRTPNPAKHFSAMSTSPHVSHIFGKNIADSSTNKLSETASSPSRYCTNEKTKSKEIHSPLLYNDFHHDLEDEWKGPRTQAPYSSSIEKANNGYGTRGREHEDAITCWKDEGLCTSITDQEISYSNAHKIIPETAREKLSNKNRAKQQEDLSKQLDRKPIEHNSIHIMETQHRVKSDPEHEVLSIGRDTEPLDKVQNTSSIKDPEYNAQMPKWKHSQASSQKLESDRLDQTEANAGVRQSDVAKEESSSTHVDTVHDISPKCNDTGLEPVGLELGIDVNNMAGNRGNREFEPLTQPAFVHQMNNEESIFKVVKYYQQLVKKVVLIQAYWKGYKIRQTLKKQRAVIKIQSLFRGYRTRKQLLVAGMLKKNNQVDITKGAQLFPVQTADFIGGTTGKTMTLSSRKAQ